MFELVKTIVCIRNIFLVMLVKMSVIIVDLYGNIRNCIDKSGWRHKFKPTHVKQTMNLQIDFVI